MDVSDRNVRPRLRVRSLPPTIVDDAEENASPMSTVPASSRAFRRLGWSVAVHTMSQLHESTGLDAAILVMNIADPDSEVLSDTATDPDLIGERVNNVEEGAEESEASSYGDDSIVDDRETHHAVGDVPVPDTVWDELIVGRETRAGFASLDRADLVSLLKSRASVMKSPPKFLRGAYSYALTEADLVYAAGDEVRVTRAWKLFLLWPRMLLRGGWSPREVGGEFFFVLAGPVGGSDPREPTV